MTLKASNAPTKIGQFSVGKDVLSYCSKCRLNLSHTIVAMKDLSTIVKVKCNTCEALHGYKDPSQSNANKTRSKKSSEVGTVSQPRSKMVSISDLWLTEMSKTKSKSQTYSISLKFKMGDLIDHSKFGPGIVRNVIDDKIEVLFRHEIKTLIHNK